MMTQEDGDSLRLTKRARPEDNTSTGPGYTIKDADLWFNDGNIILVSAQSTGFRVHRSVLARNAEFFRDMLQLAHPEEDASRVESTVLPLEDSTNDLKVFLNALYTLGYFTPGKEATPYECLASLLRMATKYLCQHLRSEVVAHFAIIYPSKREDLLLNQHLIPPRPADNKDWQHSLEAILIARQNDVHIFLPTAFYLAATLSPSALVPYLPRLQVPDQHRLLTGPMRLTIAAMTRTECWYRTWMSFFDCDIAHCQGSRFRELQRALGASPRFIRLFLEPPPHVHMEKCVTDCEAEDFPYEDMCNLCYESWKTIEIRQYGTLWAALPGYFWLGSWANVQDEPVDTDILG
ncbi:hypothetical protein BDZ89DRAFT_990864 [Hymenopellis radicata]|nr:hypothetical protein BDZ89DRAFT_990864 [Hymenopellis radicata]